MRHGAVRSALAEGRMRMKPETAAALAAGTLPKGNALAVARLAAWNAARRAGDYVPSLPEPDARAHADGAPVADAAIEVEFEIGRDEVRVRAFAAVGAADASALAERALTAVSAAALALYDVCKGVDKTLVIEGVGLAEQRGTAAGGRSAAGSRARRQDTPASRPRAGILVLSDTIARGQAEDRSGAILRDGFAAAGCEIARFEIVPDDVRRIRSTVRRWVREGVELLVTSGGTGLGPRDVTVKALEPLFDGRLPGVEQALHEAGRRQTAAAMLSRLAAGTIGRAVVICLPGSAGAARDALGVLVPSLFHAFEVAAGAGHGHAKRTPRREGRS